MIRMDLSLSYCSPDNIAPAGPVWQQLTSIEHRPSLYGHEAITTTFEETEWMILTGGKQNTYQMHAGDSFSPDSISTKEEDFHVWLLNLTSAEFMGDEEWLILTDTPEESTANETKTSCPAFEFNASDPWERVDLWQYSVPCTPTARQGHLTTVINDFLYVFHGYSPAQKEEQDSHVYRIAMSDIVARNKDRWSRILPRTTLNSTSTTLVPAKGGLWSSKENELPKMVAFVTRPNELSVQHPNQVWTYDFTKDAWELWYEVTTFDFRDYNALVIRDYLYVLRTNTQNSESTLAGWINLATKTTDTVRGDYQHMLINQTVVSYEDAVSKESVFVGYGQSSSKKDPTSENWLGVSSIHYDISGESITVTPAELITGSTDDRFGHSAVLSTAGNMYIFGGYQRLPSYVQYINIGASKHCGLNIHDNAEDDNSNVEEYDGIMDDNNDDVFSSDDYRLAEHEWFDDDQQWSDSEGDENESAVTVQSFTVILFITFLLFALLFAPLHGRNNDRHPLQHQPRHRGLTVEQLDSFPLRVLCDAGEHIVKDETAPCSICLLTFSSGDEVRDLPCKHFFHKTCVDGWLGNETTCPLCRVSFHRTLAEAQQSQPGLISRTMQSLRRDQRENVGTNDEHDDNEGLEMGSVYSLELQVEDYSADDVSVISHMSASVSNIVSAATGGSCQPSSESTNETQERRRRPPRRIRGNGGDGAVPLTATHDSVMT